MPICYIIMLVISITNYCNEILSYFLVLNRWNSYNKVGEFDGHSKRVLSYTFESTRPFHIVTLERTS